MKIFTSQYFLIYTKQVLYILFFDVVTNNGSIQDGHMENSRYIATVGAVGVEKFLN